MDLNAFPSKQIYRVHGSKNTIVNKTVTALKCGKVFNIKHISVHSFSPYSFPFFLKKTQAEIRSLVGFFQKLQCPRVEVEIVWVSK
jgi:hypothetical protein